MLDKLKKKNEDIFIKEFDGLFGENYKVSCNWGFPSVVLQIETTNSPYNKWKFTVHGLEKDFFLETLGYTQEKEGEQKDPAWVGMEGKVLNFIVSKVFEIYNKTFSFSEEEIERMEQEKPEQSEEETKKVD